MKLIDKAAVVAEIKRHISIAESQLALFGNEDERNRILWAQQKKVCEIILSFLDTLEVKEMDLEKELSYEDYVGFFKKHPNFSDDWGFDEAWVFAKYFFELGLKT